MKTNLYHSSHWKEFRQSVIELDGNACRECGRSGDGVVLQVHHKRYRKGRKPWEYGTEDCITLCKYCHAVEHGHKIPINGWVLWYQDDLGSVSGSCEFCDRDIRYVFGIFHDKYGTLEVGTNCCDRLTGDNEARSFLNRKKTFIDAKWKFMDYFLYKKVGNLELEIFEFEDAFKVKCNGVFGHKCYATVDDAKLRLFEIIEDGQLSDVLNGTLAQ